MKILFLLLIEIVQYTLVQQFDFTLACFPYNYMVGHCDVLKYFKSNVRSGLICILDIYPLGVGACSWLYNSVYVEYVN